jgi:signal transduction histidine kinase
MSISYDIVKAHQGDILVESSVGAGTIFLVQLPFKTEVDL